MRHKAIKNSDPQDMGETNKMSPKMVQDYCLLKASGCSSGQENRCDQNELPELRRWIWESGEAKGAGKVRATEKGPSEI